MCSPRRSAIAWSRSSLADALGVTVEKARAGYGEVIDRQKRLLGRDVDLYRAVL